jgi:hypothetical protein
MINNWNEKYNDEWAFAMIKKSCATGKNYSELEYEGDLAEQIYQIVALIGNVSFAQLKKTFPDVIGGRERALYPSTHENLIVWVGLKQEAIEALCWLLQNDLLEMKPTSPLTYYIDGEVPEMPVAKATRQYKTPHWVPVVLNVKSTEAPKE